MLAGVADDSDSTASAAATASALTAQTTALSSSSQFDPQLQAIVLHAARVAEGMAQVHMPLSQHQHQQPVFDLPPAVSHVPMSTQDAEDNTNE
jgi:hypothetical protein